MRRIVASLQPTAHDVQAPRNQVVSRPDARKPPKRRSKQGNPRNRRGGSSMRTRRHTHERPASDGSDSDFRGSSADESTSPHYHDRHRKRPKRRGRPSAAATAPLNGTRLAVSKSIREPASSSRAHRRGRRKRPAPASLPSPRAPQPAPQHSQRPRMKRALKALLPEGEDAPGLDVLSARARTKRRRFSGSYSERSLRRAPTDAPTTPAQNGARPAVHVKAPPATVASAAPQRSPVLSPGVLDPTPQRPTKRALAGLTSLSWHADAIRAGRRRRKRAQPKLLRPGSPTHTFNPNIAPPPVPPPKAKASPLVPLLPRAQRLAALPAAFVRLTGDHSKDAVLLQQQGFGAVLVGKAPTAIAMGTGAVDARDADTGAAPGTPTPRVPRPRAVDVDKPLPVVLAPTEEDLPAALGGSWYADPVEGSIVVVATAAAQGRAVPLSSPVPAPSRALHRTPRRSNKRHALPFSTVSVHTPKFRRVNRAAAGGRAMMSPGDMHASRGAAAGGAPEDVLVSSAGGSPTHRAFRRPPHYIQSTDEIRGVQYDADSDDEAFVESLCQAFPKSGITLPKFEAMVEQLEREVFVAEQQEALRRHALDVQDAQRSTRNTIRNLKRRYRRFVQRQESRLTNGRVRLPPASPLRRAVTRSKRRADSVPNSTNVGTSLNATPTATAGVSLTRVVKMFSPLPRTVCVEVYKYWSKKRVTTGPLLRCYAHFPLLVNWQVRDTAPKVVSKGMLEDDVTRERVLASYRRLILIRKELERARVLVDLVRKREKLKRDQVRATDHVLQLAQHVPLSIPYSALVPRYKSLVQSEEFSSFSFPREGADQSSTTTASVAAQLRMRVDEGKPVLVSGCSDSGSSGSSTGASSDTGGDSGSDSSFEPHSEPPSESQDTSPPLIPTPGPVRLTARQRAMMLKQTPPAAPLTRRDGGSKPRRQMLQRLL